MTATVAETDDAHGCGHQGRALELRCSQRYLDLFGPLIDPTLATSSSQRGGDLGAGQACPEVGVGATFNTSRASPLVRSSKATKAAG